MSRRRGNGATVSPRRAAGRPGGRRGGSSLPHWVQRHVASLLVAVLGLAVTASVTALSHLNYLHSEHRVLMLEAKLTQSAAAVGPEDLERRLGKAVMQASLTHGSRSLFARAIATSIGRAGPLVSADLYELGGHGYELGGHRPALLAAAGAAPVLAPGSGALARICATAARTPTLVVERLLRPGIQRFGYALAATAPTGGPTYVVYGEQRLPADRRVTIPASDPDSNLSFAVYFGKTTAPGALVEADAPTPLGGDRTTVLVPFGDQVVTIVVSPRGSLIGVLAESVAWILLGLGLLSTALAAAVTERMTRRRRTVEQTASATRSLYRDQRAVAETLQRALLPRRLPQPEGFEVAARYRAATAGVEVGGDWYDVVAEDGELFFSLGDVSGHGLEAAVVMAQLRHVISAYGADGADPAEVLDKVTRMMALEQHGRFATVLCGRLHLSTGAMQVANAGHVTPLLVTAGGARLLEIPPDPPLGVGTTYREHQVELAPGDAFLAVTDGLVERRGEVIDAGIERLRSGVSGELPLGELLDALLVHLVPDGADDDIAILALRRLAGVTPSAH